MNNIEIFKTKKGNIYAFDGFTNMIINIDENLANIIETTEDLNRDLIYENSSTDLKNMMDQWNIFGDKEFELDYEYMKKELTFTPYPQLILNVTENCNLRCKYCVFSGIYEGFRSHSFKRMSFDIAKNSVDRFIDHANSLTEKSFSQSPVISFYGGEPLLEFDLVKKVVEYVKSKGFNTLFNITTNGTLLNDEIIKFLVTNNFMISVSLDGSKELHDKNRVFANGSGSYDVVYNNIMKLKEEIRLQNKENEIPILILSCYEQDTDFNKLTNYFVNEYENLGNLGRLSRVTETNLKNRNLSENYTNTSIQDALKNYLLLMKQYVTQKNNPKYRVLDKFFGTMLKGLYIRNVLPYGNDYAALMGSSCIPGSKISVSTNGQFNICEKMNLQFPIGNYNKGLDYAKVENILSSWSDAFKSHCGNCAFKGICGACFATCSTNDKFTFDEFCKGRKTAINNQLTLLYSLLEDSPDAWEYLTKNKSFQMEEMEKYKNILIGC